MPYNVKVTSIRPSVDGRNQVTLNMTVATETPAAYMNLLMALEKSPLFGEVTEPQRHASQPERTRSTATR